MFEYDKQGRIVYGEFSNGYWFRKQFNKDGQLVAFRNSQGYWEGYTYNKFGKESGYQNSRGKSRVSLYHEDGTLYSTVDENNEVIAGKIPTTKFEQFKKLRNEHRRQSMDIMWFLNNHLDL